MSIIGFRVPCALCGNNLEGESLQGVCTSCQHPVADTIHPDYLDSTSWTVSADVPCVGCGYNLRTLSLASVCPECAHPVVASLRPNELHFADRTWLRRVWLGVRCLLIAGIGAAAMVLVLVLAFIVGVGTAWAVFAVLGILSLALTLLACVGVVFATRSPPQFDSQRGSNIPRNLARVAIGLPLLVIGLLAINPMVAAFSTSAPMTICAAGGLAFTMACLRRVGVRARRHGLATLTTVVIWFAGVAGGLGIASSVAMAVVMPVFFRAATSSAVVQSTGAVQPPGPVAWVPIGSNSNSAANPSPSAPMVTSVTSTSGGTTRQVVVTSVPPMGIAPMPVSGALMSLLGIASCGTALLTPVTFIIALVALFKYDRLLGTAIRQSGHASDPAAAEA